MASQPESVRPTSFGPFEFDEHSGQLRKFGNVQRLSGKPLQILALLVSRPGQIVGRDELQRHLWGGTSFGDFEQGLNTAVNKLRQTLGDSAEQSRYVETVPGRGYVFVAPIERRSERVLLGVAHLPPLPAVPPPQRRKRLELAVCGVAFVCIICFAAYWLGTKSARPSVSAAVIQMVLNPPRGFALEGAASRQSFAVSPDGSRLAFTAMDTSGEFSVFLHSFDLLESRMLAGSRDAHTVFWSPDSSALYSTANGKLWRTSFNPDTRVLVGDSLSFLFSGAWINSERIILDSFQSTYSVSATSGALERLPEIFLWPNVLPDGRHAIYVRWDRKVHRYRAFVLRTNDFHTVGELVETDSKVVFAPSAFEEGKGYLFYARGGTLLAQPFDTRRLQVVGQPLPVATHIYSFSKTAAADFSIAGSTLAYQNYVSRSQLIWIDRAGRELATLGPANINAKSARISPDGRRVATAIYDGSQGQQDLWIFDLPTNSGRRLSAESSLRDAPVWSPDSSSIAFLADSDGRPPRVHVRGLGTTDEDRVMPASGFQLPTDWSPDGRFIAFVNTGFPRTANETQGDVWLLDTTNSWKAIPLLISKFHEANPAFSPNGRWLAFTSDESGQPELYVQAFTAGDAPRMTGERHLVSRSGAQAVRWRRDGKELFYLALDGKVHAVSVTLSAEPRFSAPTPLFTISTEARAAIHSVMGFDVSADGQRFIIVRALEAPSLVVVRNWETLLKQRGKPL